jgi:MFS family permease
MACYLAGSAISQWVYGPLADRYGRRRVMLGGTAVLTAGFLLSLASFAIWPLLGSRLVQGWAPAPAAWSPTRRCAMPFRPSGDSGCTPG